MTYHRFISLGGTIMTVIDEKKYKSEKNRASIRRSLSAIFNRSTLNNSGTSILIAAALPLAAMTHVTA